MKYVSFLAALCLLVGCGGPTGVAVTGKVSFSDGAALSKGVISFTSATGTFTGKIGTDGVYTLENVTKGDYIVLITGVMDKESSDEGGMNYDDSGNYVEPKKSDEPKSLIKAEYSDSEKSPLKVTVPGDYDISVDKAS